MSPEAWIALGALTVTLLGCAWYLGSRFATKSDIEEAAVQVETNRNETAKQFKDQNDKIDTGFRDMTNTLQRIEVQTTKTNGNVIAHDGRLSRVESDLKDAMAPAQLRSKRRTRA